MCTAIFSTVEPVLGNHLFCTAKEVPKGGFPQQVAGKTGALYVCDNVHTYMGAHVYTCIVLILLTFVFHYVYSALET